jgi:hypothetical protein
VTKTAAADRSALALALLLGNEVGGLSVSADTRSQTLLAMQAYQRTPR